MTGDAGFDQVLLTISVHPSLEETVVDWLLERETGPGFTSFDIRGHSSRHDHLTVAEQVSGRQRRKRFEVAIDAGDIDAYLSALESDLGGTDTHFWVVPILASGDLNGRS